MTVLPTTPPPEDLPTSEPTATPKTGEARDSTDARLRGPTLRPFGETTADGSSTQMTEGERGALKVRFHATLSTEEALAELRAFAKSASGLHKFAAAEAAYELRSGRDMRSSMSRFRRGIGVDLPT